MEQERHILHEEHKNDLLKQVENAKKMQSLINLPAWTEILSPALESKRESMIRSFLTTKFDSLSEVILIQQGINAIDNLLSCMSEYIKTGAEAAETLKTQGKDNA